MIKYLISLYVADIRRVFNRFARGYQVLREFDLGARADLDYQEESHGNDSVAQR